MYNHATLLNFVVFNHLQQELIERIGPEKDIGLLFVKYVTHPPAQGLLGGSVC